MGQIALAIGSLAFKAIGTGISYYGQQQAANTQAYMAQYNANIAAQNAQYNAQHAAAIAQNQASWQRYDAGIAFQNARAAQNNAIAAQKEAAERALRGRREKDRQLSTVRAKFARSGVVESGSPLEVLGETAGVLETGINEMERQGITDYNAYMQQSHNFKTAGYKAQAGAAFSEYQAERSLYEGQLGVDAARYQGWAGQQQAQGMRYSAGASLLQGIGGIAGSAINYGHQGVWKGGSVA